MVEMEAFLANPTHQYCVSNEENMIIVPTTKEIEIITSIQVCLIARINFDYKKNGEKKSFSSKSNASISWIPMRRT